MYILKVLYYSVTTFLYVNIIIFMIMSAALNILSRSLQNPLLLFGFIIGLMEFIT